MDELTEGEFEQFVKDLFSKVVELFTNKEFDAAQKLCREVVSRSKKIITGKCWGPVSDGYNFVLAVAVLFRGLVNYIDVVLLFDADQLPNKHEDIEKLWSRMWDCRDRLSFSGSHCKSETIDFIWEKLCLIKKEFERKFGPGLYMSPEILVKNEICNICQKDPRSCDHIAGAIYNGIRCASIVKDFEFRTGGSIVEHPHDPRCRIWPWHFDKDKRTAQAPILTLFQVDDFMDQKEW